ncbi:bifunctional metallophosphatase/5'-nucleotidase [bacterium J10(2018)]|nr:bifunctional metallophosphatase/5'-nucleotidase [bacterium J10(2018)]
MLGNIIKFVFNLLYQIIDYLNTCTMNLRNILTGCALAIIAMAAPAEEIIILHTNDTHSALDPDDKNLGGVLRRKVLIDSIRQEKPGRVLLVDCGDAVQGTLYYTLYKGEVERKMMNALGYDIAILGNHEFDNGLEVLANELSQLDADLITTNYDLSETPLDSLFTPYTIKTIGDCKIGFLAINLDPKGMIADSNAGKVKYTDGIKAANAMAWYLRNVEHTDKVIALTHVGYDTQNPPTPSDIELASSTEGIDIIIGGHSHTAVNPSKSRPAWKVPNAAGDTVLVAQAGSRGHYLGEITVDKDSPRAGYRLISVDKRLDNRIDSETAAILYPYRQGVDSLKTMKIGRLAQEFTVGSQLLLNWVADAMRDMGSRLTDRTVDVAIVNKGGIRRGLPAGHITKEMIMTMLPFDNKLVVMQLTGRDLMASIDVMKGRGGDGISGGVDISSIDPDKTYTVVTIDYLAQGGDYMKPLTRGKIMTRSEKRLDETMIDYIEGQHNRKITYRDDRPRM